jgi:hypothetical protein
MDTDSKSGIKIPARHGITLITTTRSTIAIRLTPYIYTAVGKFSTATILDCGFNLNPNIIINHLVEKHINPQNILDKTQIVRSFSCYQVQSTLESLKPANTPLIILFLLSTFDNEDINLTIRRRILSKCITSIKAYPGSVLIFHYYRNIQKELFNTLRLAADTVLEIGLPPPELQPLRLFEEN